eukprot:m.411474 g.411474  ORF g.411474 m.411474 type:complete len:57 (-) comp28667_c0_seq1:1286-1456(-)
MSIAWSLSKIGRTCSQWTLSNTSQTVAAHHRMTLGQAVYMVPKTGLCRQIEAPYSS